MFTLCRQIRHHEACSPTAALRLYAMAAPAQETAAGYIVSQSADTVGCTVTLPRGRKGTIDEGRLSESVVIIDSSNKKHRYTPKDLSGFTFRHEGKTYRYVARPVTGNGKMFFVRVLVEGPLMNCFQYTRAFKSYPTASPGGYGIPGTALSPAPKRFFILENDRHQILTVDDLSFADRGQKFRKFFAGRPEEENLYEATVREFVDVPYFAAVLNSK